jgi:hypothetical protein
MGLPRSFWLGFSCWVAATLIAIRMFWIFPVWTNRLTRLEKSLLCVIFVAVLCAVFFKPIEVAYGNRNPLPVAPSVAPDSKASEPQPQANLPQVPDVASKPVPTLKARRNPPPKTETDVKVPEKPTPTQSCPNGICIGGNNSGDPMVINNVPPLPTISWKVSELPAGGGKHPAVNLDFSADDSFSTPVFSAECSRPCESESGGLSTGGRMFMPQTGWDESNPNIAILGFQIPSVLRKGEPLHWVIRSKDDQPVVIKSVKAIRF